ncbi:DUF445 domain-containing protein [Massilia sp. Root335]|uniref:DUF445 domain-containing protein n=1 Tax=Massilia sp. Root335 TaxID=1736517 RepID=UPI0006FF1292|nr:DUF445 domain-containing protein [Massilia sp. Root335]KQV46388.1 hypothetical protein ASC93_14770 [Massilia sp. Root335]
MKRENDIVQQLDVAENTFRRSRLRAMQRVALGLLLAAMVLFALARSRHGRHPAWGYLEAFAEAAMVGAIADWFAVVALFRHPLGIPVWHTAIIPNSKDSIGKSLGSFVENHFITEDGIVGRVRQANVAMRLGEWLLHPVNAKQVGCSATSLVRQVLQGLDDEQVRNMIRELATNELLKLDLSALAGGGMDALLAEGKQQELLDALLGRLAGWLANEDNHETIGDFLLRSLNVENGFVKNLVQGYMPKAIESLQEQIAEVQRSGEHPLRAQVGIWIADSALHLKADPAWKDAIARYQRQTVRSDSVQNALNGLWDVFRDRMLADLQGTSPALASATQSLVERTGRVLVSDPAAREWLNSAVESVSRNLVQRHRGEVTPFIEEQLAKWTKEEMSDRIELAIGRDLQFIRINGTLVGGLVGLLIHVVTTVF